MSNQFAVHNDSEQNLPEAPGLDPLYLFVSYLEWRIEGNLASLGELLAALADANEEVHLVAKSLITEKLSASQLPLTVIGTVRTTNSQNFWQPEAAAIRRG